jgi:hypothetical protein
MLFKPVNYHFIVQNFIYSHNIFIKYHLRLGQSGLVVRKRLKTEHISAQERLLLISFTPNLSKWQNLKLNPNLNSMDLKNFLD